LTRGPRHLWRGDWRADSESAREAAERERIALREATADKESAIETAVASQPAAASGRRNPRLRRIAVAALVVGVVAIGALSANAILDNDGGPKPLPAVSDQGVKPRKGQTRTGAIYAAASPAVVSIKTGTGSGTGFLIDRAGTIVTNSHVVGTSDQVTVHFGSDSDSIDGNVLGSDPSSDLAVVGVDPQKLPSGVRPLSLADSRTVRVGDRAIAIGNPFGLDRTATEGIVSGIGREIQAPNGFSIDSVIQTDAPINPGNSGGPLLNNSGRVIGVNSQIETGGSTGNVGIGFAVPSNSVRQVVPVLARGDTIKRAYLGLQSSPASGAGQTGAEVQSVVPNGPADHAGLKAGDIVNRVDDQAVKNPSDVARAIADNAPGDKVYIQVQRDGSILNLRATLGTRPGATP
jgi:putative serine protease PepD